MRTAILTILVVSAAVLSGCSFLEDDASASFSTDATFPEHGISGEASDVVVQVENTGDATGDYEATLHVDGEPVANESVAVGAGETTNVTISHTFEAAGQLNLSVGDNARVVTVYETPREFIETAETNVETRLIAENSTADATVDQDGQTVELDSVANATIRKNITAERMYVHEEETFTFGSDAPEDQTTKEWIVDGTKYTKDVNHADGETTYEKESSDEFEDRQVSPKKVLDEYGGPEHTEEEYVFIADPGSTSAARNLVRELESGAGGDLDPDEVQDIYLEYRFDRETGRLTYEKYRFVLTDFSIFETFDLTVERTVTANGEPVQVEVPAEVKQKAS